MKCIQDIHILKNKSQKRQVKDDNTQLVFFCFFFLSQTPEQIIFSDNIDLLSEHMMFI